MTKFRVREVFFMANEISLITIDLRERSLQFTRTVRERAFRSRNFSNAEISSPSLLFLDASHVHVPPIPLETFD